MQAALNQYAQILEPWAGSVATRMLTEVAARDDQSWKSIAGKIGRALSVEVKTAPTGVAMRRLLEQHARTGALFGAHPGSVRVRAGVDLVTAALDDELDAATGHELAR